MASSAGSTTAIEEMEDIEITLMTLRKPTELKKIIDSVPKPERAVPKFGLPMWYRLGLECKLPVPKMPKGKIVFSRGKIGEDVRRIGLGKGGPPPNFDLTDPYCNNVSYEYVPMHDPHLAHHYAQKPARNRMKKLGFVTKDGRAQCSLKEFNQYRKYLYNQFMDRIHVEIGRIDERARDDLTLKRVETDVARRLQIFTKTERAREHLEKASRAQADEFSEKKRLAKEREAKIRARIRYLEEFNEQNRKERASKAREKQNRIKQRVQAAAEMELRRKITMVRTWRSNEKKRIAREKFEREFKARTIETNAENKWMARVQSQTQKLQEQALLLKLYSEDMSAGANRREKKAEIYAYNTDLQLQRIRLANWKLMHGGHAKSKKLVWKMGHEFEKSKRGAKGMSAEIAQAMAREAMANAMSTQGDTLMSLGQARYQMDIQTIMPPAPIKLLDEMLEQSVIEFARRRVHILLSDLEKAVFDRAGILFFQNFRPAPGKKRKKLPRWSVQVASEIAKQYVNLHEIGFGEVISHDNEDETDIDMKSCRNRPPTPVPSRTKLAEVTFSEKAEDLPDPVAIATNLPERRKLLEMVNAAAKLLSRTVSQRVQKGMDLTIGQVTLPNMRHPMDWGEAVEGLSEAVVNNRIHSDCADVRRASEFLSHRILRSLRAEMKLEKQRIKEMLTQIPEDKDFYNPEDVEDPGKSERPNPPEVTVNYVMQLLHENKTYLMTVRDHNMSDSIDMNMKVLKDTASSLEVKEKVSSNASLLLMNPVASGDNVATCLNSAHRLKEELPPLVPCCEGKELQINEDLVRSGLSAISVKHDSCLVQCLSMSQAFEMVQFPQLQGLVKHRNSFRSLHRPDLKRVPYLRRMTPNELETLFRGYADFPRLDKKEHKYKLDDMTKQVMPSNDMQVMHQEVVNKEDTKALHAILETRSGAEDVPAGMRLHGARARLYTSVLAGANTGNQLEVNHINEEYDTRVPDVVLPEDEVQLHEELQIILPPRCDDVTAESSITAASTDTFS